MALTDKNKSTIERLKELKSLYEAGILTQEEMETEKAEIFDKSISDQNRSIVKTEKPTVNCPVCGEKIDADTMVCPHCNEKIKEEAPTPTTPVNNPTPKSDREKKNWKMIGIVGCAILAIVVVVWAISSGGEPGNSNNVDNKATPYDSYSTDMKQDENITASNSTEIDKESLLKQRVTAIFSDVFSGNSSGREGSREKKYFSEEFYDWFVQVQEHDAKYHKGEIGFFSYDIWTQSQDYYDNLSATVESISFRTDYNDVEYADVTVNITNGKSVTPLYLTMSQMDGNWYIDDMDGLKLRMKTYLATDDTEYQTTDDANSIWKYGYKKDEFGDTTDKHIIGAVLKSEYGSVLGIYISKDEMTIDCADYTTLGMGNDSRLSIKRSNGAIVRIPVDVEDDALVIYDYSTIQDLVDIFEQGNFKICIQNAIDMRYGADQTYNITIRGELKGVHDAMYQWIK